MEPGLSNSSSYFRLIDAEMKIIKRQCASINITEKLAWVELPPDKAVIRNSGISLKSFFCFVNENDYLGYMYQSMVKKKNEVFTGLLSLEIQPTKISDIDSISFKKYVF